MNQIVQAAAVATLVALGAQSTVAGAEGKVVGISTPDAVQTAQVTAPATAPSGRRHRRAQAVSITGSSQSPDDAAIQQQLQLRVLMPALAGDGGG